MPGNRARALANGDEIFPDMLKVIRGARKTITFESCIYWSGETGAAFTARHGTLQFAALRKKAYS